MLNWKKCCLPKKGIFYRDNFKALRGSKINWFDFGNGYWKLLGEMLVEIDK